MQGAGVITNESGLEGFQDASSMQSGSLLVFLNNTIGNPATDLSIPQGYLVYIFLDENLMVNSSYSGIMQVSEPGELEFLQTQMMYMPANGYFYTFVTNHSAQKVYYNDLKITRQKGQVRAVNNYYPYGLMWSDPVSTSNSTYQSKEFQFDEWSTQGMDLYDFGARLYDPVIGRWHCADPMDQFDSPYNAMANNPVVNIDPDGMWVPWAPWGSIISNIGTALSSITRTCTWHTLPRLTRMTRTYQPYANIGHALNIGGNLFDMARDSKAILDAAGEIGKTMSTNSNAFEQLYGNISDHISTAWKNSFPIDKRGNVVSQEWGGIITKNSSGNYEIADFHGAKSGAIDFDYSKVQEGNEVIGDFHTHPYSSDEITDFKELIPNFDGLGETFSDGDFRNQAMVIDQGHISSGDFFLVMAGDVLYGIEIIDTKLAKQFFKNSNAQRKLENSAVHINVDIDYSDASWDLLMDVQSTYEGSETGSSGVLFHRIKL